MKTTTVYRGPGYPVDPKKELERMEIQFFDSPGYPNVRDFYDLLEKSILNSVGVRWIDIYRQNRTRND